MNQLRDSSARTPVSTTTPVTSKPGRKCRNKFFKRHGIPVKGKICHIRNGIFRWLANPGHSWLPAYPLRLKLRDAVYRGQGKCHPVKGFRHIMVHFPHLLNMFNGALVLSFPVNEQYRETTFFPAGHIGDKMEEYRGILSSGKRQANRIECIKQPFNAVNGCGQNIFARSDFCYDFRHIF